MVGQRNPSHGRPARLRPGFPAQFIQDADGRLRCDDLNTDKDI
jgi:hypothetical protein